MILSNHIDKTMNKLIDALQSVGLGEKSAQVYLACLELGSCTVQEASRKSGVKRTSIYNFLNDLKNAGLVTEVKRGKKSLIVAENPNVLMQKAEVRAKEAQDSAADLQSALPELQGIFNVPAGKPKVTFHEGIEGLKRIYEDTLTSQVPILAFTDYDRMFEAMTFEYMKNYADRRAEQGIAASSIAPKTKWEEKVAPLDAEQKRVQKFVPDISFETEINIYGDKVALLSFRKPYAGVVIEDASIAKTLKTVWGMCWEKY